MPDSPSEYRSAFERALTSALATYGEPISPGELAPLCQRLLALSPAQQRLLVANSPRARHIQVFRHLIGRSAAAVHRDAAVAVAAGNAAVAVAESLPTRASRTRLVADVRAEAWAYLANALRVQGNLRGAQEAWAEAEGQRAAGTGEPILACEQLAMRASLLTGRGYPGDALRLLGQARGLARALDDVRMEAKILLVAACALRMDGRPAEATDHLLAASGLLEGAGEPLLMIILLNNLANLLSDSGRLEEARQTLDELEPLAAGVAGRLLRLRQAWTRARLVGRMGEIAEALEGLEPVRDAFTELAMPYDAALASLDLAALHTLGGRRDRAEGLLREAEPFLASLGLGPQALRGHGAGFP